MLYADLARVTLEAANRTTLVALRVIVMATPKGYMCAAETYIDNEAWLRELLKGFHFREMPEISPEDIFTVAVIVPQDMPPLEIIELFRRRLPEGMEQQNLAASFLVGATTEDRERAGRVIEALSITEDSVGIAELAGAIPDRAFVLVAGSDGVPGDPVRFWRSFAAAILETCLCEQVGTGEEHLIVVLTEQAASTLITSLLAIVSCYPS